MHAVETVGDDTDASSAASPSNLLDTNPAGLRVATIGPAGTGQVVLHVLERERIVPIVQVSFL